MLDPLALRARRVRALFLCGLQEGVFPARARPQPFLAEEERRRLAEASGLRLGEPRGRARGRALPPLRAVSRPEELLVLSWHVADDDGEPSVALAVRRRRAATCSTSGCSSGARAGRWVPLEPVVTGSRAGRAAAGAATGRCAIARCWPTCASASWSASSLETLDRLSGRVVRRADAAPRRLDPERRAARTGRARARGAEGHARGPAQRDRLARG